MKIVLGCDHGGYELKQEIIGFLKENGYEYEDLGCYSLDSVDYPQYGKAVGEAVAAGKADKGIVVCTTGIGISIAANKVKGVRAALCSDSTSARLTREHNDANVLALGGAIVGKHVAIDIVKTFLTTEFCGLEKHSRRIAQVMDIEQ